MSFCVEALSGHCAYPSAKGDVPDVVRRWPPWRRHFSLAQTPQCLACRAAPVSLASLRNRRHGAGAAVDALSGRIQSGVARSFNQILLVYVVVQNGTCNIAVREIYFGGQAVPGCLESKA